MIVVIIAIQAHLVDNKRGSRHGTCHIIIMVDPQEFDGNLCHPNFTALLLYCDVLDDKPNPWRIQGVGEKDATRFAKFWYVDRTRAPQERKLQCLEDVHKHVKRWGDTKIDRMK